jgi:hypothetical protein
LIWLAILTIIVTSMIEIPVALMLREPAKGRAVLATANTWMNRNGRAVGMWALLTAGSYLIAGGVIRLA